ncbi:MULTISPECIES: hypothetical protein [Halolamina]|uniref:Uncharacterized protein n=1 Tax=Halolamina pelagica TaxID=699431 RepID=A0A1I5VXA6_9EURY|nr:MULTISPECIES: hypothetical protein [Halolamina]NHX37533.1 hypothetical protein [Halolamina sp. R1-12]SFQ12119.1 hypothetical protein SAMN05216277_12116 [Halolamina pelagica]
MYSKGETDNPAGLQIAPIESPAGVEVFDPIENARYVFLTTESVSPTTVPPSQTNWYAPVDTTIDVETSQLTIPEQFDIVVRDPEGTHLRTVEDAADADISQLGLCILELTSTPIKFYVAGTGPVSITRTDSGTELTFVDSSLALGARSLHKQPGRTLTTTDDPADLMRTVSEFSAALKGTSPERTYPTLRGHPPAVEVGESLDIPGGSRRPETGITIEMPPTCSSIFTVASLAYFLGADLRPSESPRLVTEDGFEYSLTPEADESFSDVVADVLQHCFLLDCITRTEGIFPVRLAAREFVEDVLDIGLEFGHLYDQPVAERVETYLSVPMEQLEPIRPEWRLTIDMPADPAYADCLPYLVNELAIIRCYEPGERPVPNSTPLSEYNPDKKDPSETMESFVRGQAALATAETAHQADFVRSEISLSRGVDSSPTRSSSVPQDDLFNIRDADTVLHSYLGDGIPVGANKTSPQALKRQLSLDDADNPEIGVIIVCNDSEMNEETEVEDIYTGSDLLRINGEVRENLTVDELRDIFEQDSNLVHYIGHVDTRGLQCADGYLDTGTLDTVGATTFVLNGCRSFKQGSKLVEKGAFGGLVTLDDIGNSLATDVGRNIAKLLNAGWPLDGALSVVQDDALVGRDYTVLGDGTTEIGISESRTPVMFVIHPRRNDRDLLSVFTFPTRSRHLGTLYRPDPEQEGLHYLAGGEVGNYELQRETLETLLGDVNVPVQFHNERSSSVVSLRWSPDLSENMGVLDTLAMEAEKPISDIGRTAASRTWATGSDDN